jgi:ubiquinone/menaquinone biosynthesis C-methylase UbiE
MANKANEHYNSYKNVDNAVVEDFGNEWQKLDQSAMSSEEREYYFDTYFSIFPWNELKYDSFGFDAGCGSGRWALIAASRVGHIHCVDPSTAINIAQKNLQNLSNCSFHQCTISDMPFNDNSMDFGYSLGVLHHIPDTQRGIDDCVRKLKPGAPFLVYLYYAFDNQPFWFRWIWRISDIIRRFVSQLPQPVKYVVTQIIAGAVYWPMARMAKVLEKVGMSVHSWPLSAYRENSFYSMRTDALDRFGTKLEQRFTKKEIHSMMEKAGLEHIKFSEKTPFWCAVGVKK